MADAIKTYNPKEVVVACGTHIVSGYADDSFISIEPNGDGITKKVGCLQLRQRGSSRSLPLLVARKPTTASGKSTLHLLS